MAVRQRFARERETLAKLEHPGIARIVDGGSDGDADWFAMEYVQGEALDIYAKSKQASLLVRVKLLISLCDAVQYAHQNLIVHRDRKPSNVLVGASVQPRLLDFGVAKILDDANQTESRAPLTFSCAAPEQIRGDAITTATDVYALGVILYELLTGERPHKPFNLKTAVGRTKVCPVFYKDALAFQQGMRRQHAHCLQRRNNDAGASKKCAILFLVSFTHKVKFETSIIFNIIIALSKLDSGQLPFLGSINQAGVMAASACCKRLPIAPTAPC